MIVKGENVNALLFMSFVDITNAMSSFTFSSLQSCSNALSLEILSSIYNR